MGQLTKKKILLISDDFLLVSGVAQISKEIILKLSYYYDFVQIAAALSHPQAGQVVDMSQWVNEQMGITNANVKRYCSNGYSDIYQLREIIKLEQPAALFLITDPRFFLHVFMMACELDIPLIYNALWDDDPFPMYNKNFYKSCDAIFGISKQSHNIHKNVIGEENTTLLDSHTKVYHGK